MSSILMIFIIILIRIFFLSFYFSKYYEKDALLADPVEGPILASLLGKKLIEMSVLFFNKFVVCQVNKALKLFGCPPPPKPNFENWEKVFTAPIVQNLKKFVYFFLRIFKFYNFS